MSAIKLIVFELDDVLTTFNVLQANAGWGEYAKASPPPYAVTELGQMRRMAHLSQTSLNSAGGFSLVHFGSAQRVGQLRLLLQLLKQRDVELVVCTDSFVGVARMCLAELGLLEFFSAVYGRIGNPHGQTDYDNELSAPASAEEIPLLGSEEDVAEGFGKIGKVAKLRDLKAKRHLHKAQIVVIDSDPQIVEECVSNKLSHALHLLEPGLTIQDMVSLQQVTSAHLEEIREHVGLDPFHRVAGTGKRPEDFSDLKVFEHMQAMEKENERFEMTLLDVASPAPAPRLRGQNTVRALFKKWDLNQSGTIDCSELQTVLVKTGLPGEVVPRIFAEMDADCNGVIDYDEFCDWIFATELGSMIRSKLKINELPPDRAVGPPVVVGDGVA
eukprot:TRINITY_DN35254_c0_g1_i1.p1 TRINITY_DN35254_c0_g1~~TRINITY_DN35254_c0_g1_i1.p1  ORF type:complete len:385 (+),score=71.13 TRINITY_DN35254_c0_g1_i1:70-1224(+)